MSWQASNTVAIRLIWVKKAKHIPILDAGYAKAPAKTIFKSSRFKHVYQDSTMKKENRLDRFDHNNKNKLPKTSSSYQKSGSWETNVPFWEGSFFENTVIVSGANDEVREGISINFRKTLGWGNDPTSTSPIARS